MNTSPFDFSQVKILTKPVPAGRTRQSSISSLLRRMKPGECFEIPIAKRNTVVSVAHSNEIPVLTRTTDAEKGVCTVWRVEPQAAEVESVGAQINAATKKKSKKSSPLSLPKA